MSRTLRSALTLAQGLPGPSRPVVRRVVAPVAPMAMPLASRTFFNLANLPLPKSWRRAVRKDEDAPKDGAAETTPAAAESTEVPEVAEKGLFEDMVDGPVIERRRSGKAHEHKYKSGFHKISHRKLNDLSRQVAGLPVDEAVVQLAFGAKRAGRTWVKSTLALARDHAEDKGMSRDKLIVAETWVSKGRKIPRVDIKGRGRMGIKHHPSARIHFVLREGKTWQEKQDEKRRVALSKVRSAGMVREDGKIRRKFNHGWAW